MRKGQRNWGYLACRKENTDLRLPELLPWAEAAGKSDDVIRKQVLTLLKVELSD